MGLQTVVNQRNNSQELTRGKQSRLYLSRKRNQLLVRGCLFSAACSQVTCFRLISWITFSGIRCLYSFMKLFLLLLTIILAQLQKIGYWTEKLQLTHTITENRLVVRELELTHEFFCFKERTVSLFSRHHLLQKSCPISMK